MFQRSPHLASKIDWQSQFISSELIPFGKLSEMGCREPVVGIERAPHPGYRKRSCYSSDFCSKSQVSTTNSSQDPSGWVTQACRLHASARFPASNSLPAGVGVLGRVPSSFPSHLDLGWGGDSEVIPSQACTSHLAVLPAGSLLLPVSSWQEPPVFLRSSIVTLMLPASGQRSRRGPRLR